MMETLMETGTYRDDFVGTSTYLLLVTIDLFKTIENGAPPPLHAIIVARALLGAPTVDPASR
jgi:hypothetical protein